MESKVGDSKFFNFLASLLWSHTVNKPHTVCDFWKVMTWSMRSIWEGPMELVRFLCSIALKFFPAFQVSVVEENKNWERLSVLIFVFKNSRSFERYSFFC